MSDNNKVSVKIGNKVYSLRERAIEYWDNVTATYPNIGGEIQTTFIYGINGTPSPNVIDTGGFFVYDSKIYGMANMYEGHVICPLTAKYDSQIGLPLYFDTYNAPVLYQDEQMTKFVTDYPEPGTDVYCTINGDHVALRIPETYSSVTAGSTATTEEPGPKPTVNNIASVKLGDKVLSLVDAESSGDYWDDVTATYNNVGGTLQTEFQYEDGGTPTPPTETGGYFISDDGKIWSLERWDGMDNIYASPLRPSWDGSKYSLPLYFNTYETPTICSDNGLQHPVTEFPHEGDTFYYLDTNVHTVANVHLYSTMTAGTTATAEEPAPPTVTYNKPLIYNRDLDCIEKSLGNIEVTGDMKAGSVTTPSLTVTQPVENLTVENLTVTDTASINHATIVTEEDIHSEADFIELRVDNPLPTPSTGSGFKVKNYDGNNNNLELVTDSSGTFRIGAENNLQAVLTRDEAAQMANGAPLVWNADANKAQTTSTTDGNKVLKSVKNSQTGIVSYEWSSSGSGAVWRGTQAQLTAALAITDPNDEAYIPNNAMIIITDADEAYLIGEEQ